MAKLNALYRSRIEGCPAIGASRKGRKESRRSDKSPSRISESGRGTLWTLALIPLTTTNACDIAGVSLHALASENLMNEVCAP